LDRIGSNSKSEYELGLAACLGSAVLWGFLPIYWQALRPIDSYVIILYRILLVAVVCFVVDLKIYGIGKIIEPMKQKGILLRYLAAGLLITFNWSLYIWAVNADFVIQTCIGYYIEPLVVCIFGIVFFSEKISRYKMIALVFACAGIVILLLHFGELPLIAIGLSSTFAAYAAIKKSFRMEAMLSLFYETIFLAPPALIAIIYLEINNKGALGTGQPYQYGLLLLCGIMTATPLGLFAASANRLPLITLGLIEYVSPTITLILGIFLFKEPFDIVQLMAFVVIWIGLLFFTYGEIKAVKSLEPEKQPV